MAVWFQFLSLTSLVLWESSSTTQGPAGCAGAVTPVSLGRDALGRCPLIRALCPPHAWGSGPFLFLGGVVRSVFSVVSSSKVCWPRTTEWLWEKWWDTSFHWGLCQAAYGPSTVLTPVHPRKELTVSQLAAPCSLGNSHVCALLPVWAIHSVEDLTHVAFCSLSRYSYCPGARATTSEVFQRSPTTQLL